MIFIYIFQAESTKNLENYLNINKRLEEDLMK